MSVVSTQFVTLTTLDKFVDSLSLFTNRIGYFPSSQNVVFSRCLPIYKHGDKCNATDLMLGDLEISSMRDKCSSEFSFVEVKGFVYKNKYCALCNGEKIAKIKHLIRIKHRRSKSVFYISLAKQHLFLNYVYGKAPKKWGMDETHGSWVRARCQLAPDGVCEVMECSLGYIRRPSGMCAAVYGIGVAFDIGAARVSHKYMKYIEVLINCHLSYLDLYQSDALKRFAFTIPQTDRHITLFQLSVYSDRLLSLRNTDQRGVVLISKIAHIAKSILIYKMNFSEQHEARPYHKHSLIQVAQAFKYEFQGVEDVIHGLNAQKGEVLLDKGHVRACVCTNQLHDEVFNCRLICFQNHVFAEDLQLVNTPDTCFERALRGNSAVYLRPHIFVFEFVILFIIN